MMLPVVKLHQPKKTGGGPIVSAERFCGSGGGGPRQPGGACTGRRSVRARAQMAHEL